MHLYTDRESEQCQLITERLPSHTLRAGWRTKASVEYGWLLIPWYGPWRVISRSAVCIMLILFINVQIPVPLRSPLAGKVLIDHVDHLRAAYKVPLCFTDPLEFDSRAFLAMYMGKMVTRDNDPRFKYIPREYQRDETECPILFRFSWYNSAMEEIERLVKYHQQRKSLSSTSVQDAHMASKSRCSLSFHRNFTFRCKPSCALQTPHLILCPWTHHAQYVQLPSLIRMHIMLSLVPGVWGRPCS